MDAQDPGGASITDETITTRDINHPPSKVARTSLENITPRACKSFVKGTASDVPPNNLSGGKAAPAQGATSSAEADEIATSSGVSEVFGKGGGSGIIACSGHYKENPSNKQSATEKRSGAKRARPDEDFDFEFEVDYTGYDPGVGKTRDERKANRKEKLRAAAAATAEKKIKATATAAGKKKAAATAGDKTEAGATSGDKKEAAVKARAKVKAVAGEDEQAKAGVGTAARAEGKATYEKGFGANHKGIRETSIRNEISISSNGREGGGDICTITCCECGKHRSLPRRAKLEDMVKICQLKHANVWVCSDNFWDSAYSSCYTPENKDVFSTMNSTSQSQGDSPHYRANNNEQAASRSESSSSNNNSSNISTSIKPCNGNIKHYPSRRVTFGEAKVAASSCNLTQGRTGSILKPPRCPRLTGAGGGARDKGTAWEGKLGGANESTMFEVSAGGGEVSGGGRRVRFREPHDELRDVVNHRLPASDIGAVHKSGDGQGNSQRDITSYGRPKGINRFDVLLQVSARRRHAFMATAEGDSAAGVDEEGRGISRDGGDGGGGGGSESVMSGRQGVMEWRSTSGSVACATGTAAPSAAPSAMSAPTAASASAPRDSSSAPSPSRPVLGQAPSGAILGKHGRSCGDEAGFGDQEHTAVAAGASGATDADGYGGSKQWGNMEEGGGGGGDGGGSRPAAGDEPVDSLSIDVQEPAPKRPRQAVLDESTNSQNSAIEARAAAPIGASSGAATCGGSWREGVQDGRLGGVGTRSVPVSVRCRSRMPDVSGTHDELAALREDQETNAVMALAMLEDMPGAEIETTTASGV